MITVTSLTHPTMIAKIRLAMRYAFLGQGHLMNGHDHRCYIEDSKGRNIMRLQYLNNKFTVYGDCSKDITEVVKNALKQVQKSN